MTVDPSNTRECHGYPGLVVPANPIDALAAGKSFVTTPGELTAALDELEQRYGPLECCGDPGDCGTCGP